jgi:hypothetical protein
MSGLEGVEFQPEDPFVEDEPLQEEGEGVYHTIQIT